MRSPGTPEQLADAIETLVTSYINEVRLAARQAVERCTGGPVAAGRTSKGGRHRPAPVRSSTKRRSRAELDDVCEVLCKLVRARPGESVATLADEMGVAVSTLQRPMAKLKSEGRVRSVGQRHLTRYFPAVVRGSSSKE